MNTSSRSVRNICTDIPDEIRAEIILCLNPSDRVSLADSCKRFHALVFEDKILLRDLDFSKESKPVSSLLVRKYFLNENGNKHILRVNLENHSFEAKDILQCIGRAINLVDINIHGTNFDNRWQLQKLLKPLIHVRRLSIDWPLLDAAFSYTGDHIGSSHTILQQPFGKLKYLSVRLPGLCYAKEFYHDLQFCQELKELRMMMIQSRCAVHETVLGSEFKLKNLEILEYFGDDTREVENYLVSILPSPKEWIHFQLADCLIDEDGFYLERNVEICEEMVESISMKRLLFNYPPFASKLGGFVVSACLLQEIMKINHKYLPHKLCCFSSAPNDHEGLALPTVFHGSKLWLLKAAEAKRLLKDPKYPISYLYTSHAIEQNCDAHIVTSTFPSFTELVLCNIMRSKQKSDSASLDIPDELPNVDSSFTKIVAGTPRVRHLIILANSLELEGEEGDENVTWDLAALHSISGWKSLTTLRLSNIPIRDGKFLIEIGKQCKHLDTIVLYDLGHCYTCCYMNGLWQMLIHCSNLKYFMIRHDIIDQLPTMLRSLVNNPKLKTVHVTSDRKIDAYFDLRESIKQLLRHCLELTTFQCSIDGSTELSFERESYSSLYTGENYCKVN